MFVLSGRVNEKGSHMLSIDAIEGMRALAGSDYSWSSSRGGHRPTAKVREPLRSDLYSRQGGVCPVCGDMMGDDVSDREFNHVVSAGPDKRGYFPLNVFVGHPACNTMCERVHGEVIPLEGFKRPDLIPAEWTPFPILKACNV